MSVPLALLLPGQGAQYRGMGTGLYRDLPAFAAIIDEVFLIMGSTGDKLRSDWLAADSRLPVDDVRRSQPLLFAIDYALGRLLMNMEPRPAVLLGHSIRCCSGPLCGCCWRRGRICWSNAVRGRAWSLSRGGTGMSGRAAARPCR